MTRKTRNAVFDPDFRQDLRYWIEADQRIALREMDLVEDILRDPLTGRGKPEPLQFLNNTWSRRINQEHRLVYRVLDDRIDFLQAHYHYKK